MLFQGVLQGTSTLCQVALHQAVPCSQAWCFFASCLSLCSLDLRVYKLSACQATPHTELQTVREGKNVCPNLTLSASVSTNGLPLSLPGASQATNRENIQKAINRLDEDLTTLGQMSKLSESLGFPHQVSALCLRLGQWGWWGPPDSL